MTHRILHQRLQKQRWHETTPRRGVDFDPRCQPRPESHLLDGQIARDQIDLFGQGDPLPRSDAQREPEEVGHELRHLPRVSRS